MGEEIKRRVYELIEKTHGPEGAEAMGALREIHRHNRDLAVRMEVSCALHPRLTRALHPVMLAYLNVYTFFTWDLEPLKRYLFASRKIFGDARRD